MLAKGGRSIARYFQGKVQCLFPFLLFSFMVIVPVVFLNARKQDFLELCKREAGVFVYKKPSGFGGALRFDDPSIGAGSAEKILRRYPAIRRVDVAPRLDSSGAYVSYYRDSNGGGVTKAEGYRPEERGVDFSFDIEMKNYDVIKHSVLRIDYYIRDSEGVLLARATGLQHQLVKPIGVWGISENCKNNASSSYDVLIDLIAKR